MRYLYSYILSYSGTYEIAKISLKPFAIADFIFQTSHEIKLSPSMGLYIFIIYKIQLFQIMKFKHDSN